MPPSISNHLVRLLYRAALRRESPTSLPLPQPHVCRCQAGLRPPKCQHYALPYSAARQVWTMTPSVHAGLADGCSHSLPKPVWRQPAAPVSQSLPPLCNACLGAARLDHALTYSTRQPANVVAAVQYCCAFSSSSGPVLSPSLIEPDSTPVTRSASSSSSSRCIPLSVRGPRNHWFFFLVLLCPTLAATDC